MRETCPAATNTVRLQCGEGVNALKCETGVVRFAFLAMGIGMKKLTCIVSSTDAGAVFAICFRNVFHSKHQAITDRHFRFLFSRFSQ